jgi:hypothetical protein
MTTTPTHTQRPRRGRCRLAAISVLLGRLVLLVYVAFAFLLLRTHITQALVFAGWLAVACAFVVAERAIYRSFARTWKEDRREPPVP